MISYTALILGIVGTIWTIFIIATIVTRKKKKKSKKKLFESLLPFASRTYPRESLEYSFAHALKTLEKFIPHKNYRYHLPWYLVIGNDDSGKTTFIDSCDLEKPIDGDSFSSKNSDCYWHFFNQGVFLDIKGSLVQKDNSDKKDDAQWDKLLTVINKSRSQKGLDGLILVVSLKDFIGSEAKSLAILMQNAEYIYAKLWKLQKTLQLRLPIYVVFSHLDLLDGFDRFTQTVPKHYLKNIFGWSNPNALDNNFNPIWIEDMFEDMSEAIGEIQNEIFVQNDAQINSEILTFFNQFYALKESLKIYLEHVFQANTYADGHFMRGAYFVGANNFSPMITIDENEKWPILPWQKRSNEESSHGNSANHVFVEDLVNKKIFLEKNLAKLSANANVSTNKHVKLIQALICVLGFSGTLYLRNAYRELNEKMNIVAPHVSQIVDMINERKKITNKVDNANFIQEAQTLLNSIVNIVNTNLRFLFIPNSWISSLHYRLFDLLEKSNDEILIKAIAKKIEEQYINLAKFEIDEIASGDNHNLKNPLEHNAYQTLHGFVVKLVELEQIQRKFSSAVEDGNVESFSWLIKKLIGIDIPKRFYQESKFFRNSLQSNLIVIPKLHEHREAIKTKIELLFNEFINRTFVLDNFVENYRDLNEMLYMLEQKDQNFSSNQLRMLQSQISKIITFANSNEFSWIQHSVFKMTRFVELLYNVENATMLGPDFARSMMNRVDAKFQDLKQNMCAIKVAVLGSIFYFDDAKMIKVSDEMIELQGLLNTIFSEPFMQDFGDEKLMPLAYGNSMLWDADKLNELNNIFISYEDFLNKKLKNYPKHLFSTLRNVTKDNFDKLVASKLAQAQKIIASDFTDANVLTIAENIKLIYPAMSSLLQRLRSLNLSTFNILLELEKQKNNSIIKQANSMLETEDLYSVDLSEILMGNLTKEGFTYFPNVGEYIANQKMRVMHFAKDIIEPVVRMLQLLDAFDSSVMNVDIQKWDAIVKDIDTYIKGNSSSSLGKLEVLLMDVEKLKIETLNKILNENTQLNLKAENYFQDKAITLKKKLSGRINEFINRTIKNHYVCAVAFLKAHAKFFPFDLNGAMGTNDMYDNLDILLKTQVSETNIIKQINPDIQNANMNFITLLEKINQLMHYVLNAASVMTLTIKSPNDFSESYEANLEYLVDVAITSANATVFFPDSGVLKVADRLTFKFKLATQSGMAFAASSNLEYKITGNILTINLDRKNLIKMLLQTAVTKSGQTVLRFDIPLVKVATGEKRVLTFAVPVEIAVDALPISLPEQSFANFVKEIKNA